MTDPEPLITRCPVPACLWQIELELRPITPNPYVRDPQSAMRFAIQEAVAAEGARVEAALNEHGASHEPEVWLTACQEATETAA